MSGIINEICAAIWGALKDKYVRSPQTPKAWKAIAKDFQEIWNLPQHCSGAIDGKHVVGLKFFTPIDRGNGAE